MAGIQRARYKVEVAWSQQSRGMLTFGTSHFGGTDQFAGSAWSWGFTGPQDDITNPGDGTRVDTIQITRGRDDDLASTQAGTVTVTIRDMAQKYNRRNASSVLNGMLDGGQPIRVSAIIGGTTYPLYYGFIDTVEWSLSGQRGGQAQIHAVDFLSKLTPIGQGQGANPVIAPTGSTTTGAAIKAILDYYGWTDPTMISLGVGDVIPNFQADGSAQALRLIEDLLLAERGFFFVSNSGKVTYQSRAQRFGLTSQATIAYVMDAISAGADVSRVVNRWIVQRTDLAGTNLGTPQQADDASSQRAYNIIDQTLSTPYVASDAQAQYLAQFMLLETKTPGFPAWSVPIRGNKDAPTLLQMVTRDLGDRVTLQEAVTPDTSDWYIEQIQHMISDGGLTHDTTWKLSAVPSGQPFIFGVSQLGTGVLGY